jgi:hypothetical protein
MNLVHTKSALAISKHGLKIKYLMPHKIDALTMDLLMVRFSK